MMWWPLPRYSIWLLLIFSLARPVTTFSLPGCNSAGNFDIVKTQKPSLTCTGLTAQHNIYWSITDPSTQEEIRIAECKECNQNCPPCSNPIVGYTVSREMDDSTTLQFLNTSLVTDGSTIKCSAFLNHTKATCRLYVIQAYTISECEENAINIEEPMQTPINCEGLVAAHNMYWTITHGNGTVSTVAECKACANNSYCPACIVTHSDFNVTREDNSSTLVMQNNIKQKDDTTLRCSKGDNVTHDDCTLCVEPEPFNLPECSRNSAGNFDIVQNQQPFLTCTGLTADHNIYWSITDFSSKQEIRIGECGSCSESCPPCLSIVLGYNVSRQEGNTKLHFLNPAQINDKSRIKCSSVNNCSRKTCTLFGVPAYRIPKCMAGAVTVVENKKSNIVCEGLLRAQNMYWTITYNNGTVSTIAECSYCPRMSTTCPPCVTRDTDFNVTRERQFSTLVLQNNVRQKDGATLTCSKRDNATRADCRIQVIYILEDANVTLRDNWTVAGNVRVDTVPASDDNITCVWCISANKQMQQLATSNALLIKYDGSENNQSYYNVSCQLNAPLSNSIVGNNTISVKINPGNVTLIAGVVTAENPGPLFIENSTCQPIATEGSDVSCTCKIKGDRIGYPPGRVSWMTDASSANLELKNIQREQSGVMYICRLTWGPQHEVLEMLNYSITVNAPGNGLPVATVTGGAFGFVFIVAAIIIIAVVVKKRRSKREATNDRQDTGPPDDEFEEHINELYQSADDPDLSRHCPPNSLVPIMADSPDVQSAGSVAPQNHVYAKVNKEKKKNSDMSKEQPGKPNDVKQHTKGGKTKKRTEKGENQGPLSEEQGAVYTECLSDSKFDNYVPNVYTNVDESPPLPTDQDTQAANKYDGNVTLHEPDPNTYYNTETTRHQGDYTDVQPELNEAEGMTKTAESADDYRHLQFSRPEQLEENPNYNHLKDL